MQREEPHIGHTPPPPYTLVDQQFPGNNNNNNSNSNNNNHNNPTQQTQQTQQQYHSQNPYPATVIPPDADFRLAQKLQDEEYARWAESNPQQEYYPPRTAESSAGTQLLRSPMPPIPEHYQYNHHQSYQTNPTHQSLQPQQYPIIYASPNQPPLPYAQTSPFVSNGESGGGGGGGGQTYYGSLNQGYYSSSQPHPFYNAPYHNYQQIPQRNLPYRSSEEEEDNSSCFTGFALASLLCYCWSLYDE